MFTNLKSILCLTLALTSLKAAIASETKDKQSHETEATVETWSAERKGVHFTVKSVVNSQHAQGSSLMTRELVRVSLP